MSAATRGAAPLLSVAMPVFNAEAHVDEAIRSVLGQSWGDFEFVVYDDSLTDRQSVRSSAVVDRDAGWIRRADRGVPAGSVGSLNAACAPPEDGVVAASTRMTCRCRTASAAVGIIQTSPRVARRGSLWRVSTWRAGGAAPLAGPAAAAVSVCTIPARFNHVPAPPSTGSTGTTRRFEYWGDVDLDLRLSACGQVLVWPGAGTATVSTRALRFRRDARGGST